MIGSSPALTTALELDRAAVLQGQLWRLFTGHFTHFGSDHLKWDLIGLLVLGSLAESSQRRQMVVTLLGAAAVIGSAVVLFQPQFSHYRGLSGLDSALFGLVVARMIATGWREKHHLSWMIGGLALAGFGAKCVYELTTHSTYFATGMGYSPVPLAHALGALAGCGVVWAAATSAPTIAAASRKAPAKT